MKITQGSILLHDMRFYAYHGVMEQERRVGGEYLVSLQVEADLSGAVMSDAVVDTVNYAELYDVVRQEMAQPSQLLEHVAGRIGQRVLDEFPRTFLSAVNCYDMPLDDALKLISPVERISELPDIPYLITADELDVIIPLEGLEKYVKRLTARGLNVNYMRLDNMGHGGISDVDRERLNEFVVRNCLSRE